MDWLLLIVTGVVSGAISWYICMTECTKVFTHILKEIGVDDIPRVLKSVNVKNNIGTSEEPVKDVAITVEKDNDILYAYTKFQPKFLAQGKTPEELFQNLGRRLINANVIINEDDDGYDYILPLIEKLTQSTEQELS